MIKIDNWSLHGLILPYQKPVAWVDVTETGAPLLILRIVGTDGSVGVGEVTVKPTWGGVSYRSIMGALEDIFIPMASSIDVTDPSAFYESARIVPENLFAKALVDNALWDLRAASLAIPLWKQWNGEESAEVSWMVTRQAPDLMIAEAVDVVDRLGIKTLKLKGGQGMAADLLVLREVRAAVGNRARLYVDANWHYTAEEAAEYVRRLADLGVVAAEDPYRLAPDTTFERIQQSSEIPILVDFFVSSLSDAKLFGERGIQALSLKPARVGLTECLLQAKFAQEHGIRVHVGFGGESSVGSCIALQLAGSLECRKTWLPAEVTFFTKMLEDLLLNPLNIENGAIRLPQMTSIASLLDFEKVKKLSQFQARGKASL